MAICLDVRLKKNVFQMISESFKEDILLLFKCIELCSVIMMFSASAKIGNDTIRGKALIFNLDNLSLILITLGQDIAEVQPRKRYL